MTEHNHTVFYHINMFVEGQQLLSWIYEHVCVSVSVRNMTSASSCWLIVNRCCCRYQPRFVSLSVCLCTRASVCVCVFVCAYDHKCISMCAH